MISCVCLATQTGKTKGAEPASKSESVQACSLPADQAGRQVAPHQCDEFVWLKNFSMVLCSHISTEVFWMVQNKKQVNPKAFLLSDVWSHPGWLSPSWPIRSEYSCYTSPIGLSSCEHFYKFLYGPVVSYFNWSISNGSKLKTRKPKGISLEWCVIISRLALSQLTKHTRKLMLLHLTKMRSVYHAENFFSVALWPPASTVQPKALLLGESIPGLFPTSWRSRVSSCTSQQCDGSVWRRIFV